MNKITLLFVIMFLFATNTFSQMQKGDKSLGFQAYLSIVEDNTMGSILGTFGYNFSDKFRLTVAPSISVSTSPVTTYNATTGEYKSEIETSVSLGSSFLGEYYFSNKSKVSPFLLAGLYWPDFSVSNKAFVTGPGLNYFISKNVSWKSNLEFGVMFIPGIDIPGAVGTESSTIFITLLTTGLDFKF